MVLPAPGRKTAGPGSPLQSTTAGTGPEGELAAGILTHITATGTAGTTMGRCREMVSTDVGLDISVVLP